MPVHSLHIFDRKGKTLFTKCFVKDAAAAAAAHDDGTVADHNDPSSSSSSLRAEQRQLVFGMLFSLREVATSLSPDGVRDENGLQSIRTGAATLHTYESAGGHRLALYVTETADDDDVDGAQRRRRAEAIRRALVHIYHELWIQCVVRSPLYRPTAPNVEDTNFAGELQLYLANQPWYKG